MGPSSHPSDGQLDAATWCRHLVPDGSVYASLADHRQQLVPPELFADLVVQGRSHPSVPAEVVATVMVLQALEGLSDREAISALRRDIAWKVACGLRLDDGGCWTPRSWRMRSLRHRPVSRHPQVPGRLCRADHQLGPGQLHQPLSLLPAASALRHRQGWPHHPPAPARGGAARRPPPGDHPQLPGALPALAADGGALDRLAGRRWLPAGALSWHRPQRPVVVAAGHRGQPAPAAGPWPCSSGPALGPGLQGRGSIRARLRLAPTLATPCCQPVVVPPPERPASPDRQASASS